MSTRFWLLSSRWSICRGVGHVKSHYPYLIRLSPTYLIGKTFRSYSYYHHHLCLVDYQMIRFVFSSQRLYSFDSAHFSKSRHWIFWTLRDSLAWAEFFQFWERQDLFDCSWCKCLDCWLTCLFILDTIRRVRSKRHTWRSIRQEDVSAQWAYCER
jgi:hypothetical protein